MSWFGSIGGYGSDWGFQVSGGRVSNDYGYRAYPAYQYGYQPYYPAYNCYPQTYSSYFYQPYCNYPLYPAPYLFRPWNSCAYWGVPSYGPCWGNWWYC